MTATIKPKPWDLSHVLDLVNSLSFQDSQRTQDGDKGPVNSFAHNQSGHDEHMSKEDSTLLSSTLGDFDKIFQYLGSPVVSPTAAPAVQVHHIPAAGSSIFTTKTDYTSDGAAQTKTSTDPRHGVCWRDISDTEEQVNGAVSDSSLAPDSPTLTKSQRKKKNRRERKASEAATAAAAADKKAKRSVFSESEVDFVRHKTPAKKAGVHAAATPPRQYNLRARDASGKAVTANTPDSLLKAAKIATERLESAKKANHEAVHNENIINRQASAIHPRNSKHTSHLSLPLPSPAPLHLSGYSADQAATQTLGRHLQHSEPTGTASLRFVPSTVGPDPQTPRKDVPSAVALPDKKSVPAKPAPVIHPIVVRSGEDRNWALLIKLIGDFYQDRKHLISPMNLTTHNNDPNGIHVFVDASNIFIGFVDQLKRSRHISPWTQVPAVDLSFDALALLIERRRPVARRVLVGSTPTLPAFEKAKAVGYECSILEKVYKARELTERQIYFKDLDRYGVAKRAKAPPANNVATINGVNGSGSGSGSETNTPQYAPARMIEQGVDEILHLKILESVVDAEKPGTMVLATGDAAQAEYSQGFMAMAERALKKGWAVELVSWSKNISAMYRRKEWQEAWGERFKIITLDDYAEELLDM